MNPQFEQSQGLRLPQPAELGSAQGIPESGPAPERQGATPKTATAQHPLYAAAPPVPAPLPQDGATAAAVATATAAAVNDDSDNPNVDLEWINKAKRIVEQTKADPSRQSSELSKFKAEYLKVRHNVTIRVAEDK